MKVVIIGGLNSGRRITEYLNNDNNTELLKVYVLKDDIGNQYSDFVTFDDIVSPEQLVKVDNINKYSEEINQLQPDIIFVVGWSQLINDKIINSAKIGVIGFHPSKLPKDRGRSVLAWQIAEGYKVGCVSMFWIDSGVDSGNIIAQKEFKIDYEYTIREVLDKVYDICVELVRIYYPVIMNGNIISISQDTKLATYRTKRGKKDGIINWKDSSTNIYNLIRAITFPYPGASTFYKGNELIVLEAKEKKCHDIYKNAIPGTILFIEHNKGIGIKTKDNIILIKKIMYKENGIMLEKVENSLKIGDVLE
ncbi:methionyl-tRNA formyltransferase [Clostridium lundense]|uniref:methionyl-tRNA formyltransferase n=1 Tax=Clostridium lundense TaxID=319475 RepID=UPI0004820479|nr:formyltransferase family protein [Clostridium lundense]